MTQPSGTTPRPVSGATSYPADETAHRGSPVVIDSTREPTGHQFEERTGYEYEQRGRSLAPATGSRVRGGPVWAGFVIGFATWILLELALFALDLGALAANVVPNADNTTWWWSGLAAVVAFLLGGLVAGASTTSESVADGVLHGITVWSLTVLALIVLSAAGAGIGFGVIGDILATSPTLAEADATAVNDAQSAAAAALLALTVTLAAAAIGGALGAKIWPRHRDTIDLRRHSRAR